MRSRVRWPGAVGRPVAGKGAAECISPARLRRNEPHRAGTATVVIAPPLATYTAVPCATSVSRPSRPVAERRRREHTRARAPPPPLRARRPANLFSEVFESHRGGFDGIVAETTPIDHHARPFDHDVFDAGRTDQRGNLHAYNKLTTANPPTYSLLNCFQFFHVTKNNEANCFESIELVGIYYYGAFDV